jgi:hypothetical protein
MYIKFIKIEILPHITEPTHLVTPASIYSTHLTHPITHASAYPTHPTPPPITPHIEETPTGSTQTYSPPPSLIPTTVPPASAPLALDNGRRRNSIRNTKARGCGTGSAYHHHYKSMVLKHRNVYHVAWFYFEVEMF